MTYSTDKLLAEIAAAGLCVQSLCETYWSTHDPRWTCWLRSTTNKHYASYGSGSTAGEALNSAMNATVILDPGDTVEVNSSFSLDLPSLDSLLPSKRPPVEVAASIVRRFTHATP